MTGTLIAETNAAGQTQKEYIWNDMEPVAQIDNEITYLHSDHLYTPRRGTDDLQTTVWQWESNAFGNTKPQIETTEVNLRFPGQYQDEETDLHYNWNRFYDPTIGRYVTSDPIGLDGGVNTYSYSESNPVVNIDPTGLKSCSDCEKKVVDEPCRESAKNQLFDCLEMAHDIFDSGMKEIGRRLDRCMESCEYLFDNPYSRGACKANCWIAARNSEALLITFLAGWVAGCHATYAFRISQCYRCEPK